MLLTNYHTHCDYCDGAGRPEDYVGEALSRQFDVLGFSSHAPIEFEKDWTLDEKRVSDYMEEIESLKEKYRGRLEICRGLEIDYLEGLSGPASPRFKDLNLDYAIGSVHMIKTTYSDKYLAIDGPESHLKELIEKNYGGSVEKLSDKYYSLVREMIRIGGFQILGHMDLIKKRNSGDAYFSESETWYINHVMETLDALAGTSIIMEVNTGGISRGAIDAVYPSPWILKEAAVRKIPLTLNADAHAPDHIDFHYDESLRIIKDCGFTELHALKGGEWITFPVEA